MMRRIDIGSMVNANEDQVDTGLMLTMFSMFLFLCLFLSPPKSPIGVFLYNVFSSSVVFSLRFRWRVIDTLYVITSLQQG